MILIHFKHYYKVLLLHICFYKNGSLRLGEFGAPDLRSNKDNKNYSKITCATIKQLHLKVRNTHANCQDAYHPRHTGLTGPSPDPPLP